MQTGTGFTPITTFSGTFDGQNHILKNIYINSSRTNVGFIAYLSGLVEKFKISGNINQNIDYNSNYCCGGVVGEGSSNATLKLCTNNAKITGTTTKGGLAGRFYGLLISCINFSDIRGGGGVCGTGNATIINSYNLGNIESNSSCAGILGGGYWSISSKIYNCCNYGTINGTLYSIYCTPGGMFGYMENSISSLDIVNCYNVGLIKSKLNWNGYYGPIIGKIRVITPNVKNCFYLDTCPPQTSIATPYSQNYMQSEDFLAELNNYIESNEDNIDTTGWAKWIRGDNGYPTLDFHTIWNGTTWVNE